MKTWYSIDNVQTVDSPALVVYPDRVKENIRIMKSYVQDTARLRPHVKTSKSPDVCRLLMEAGINKFKSATIAESEMLAMVGAKDVLLAYQPVGPKIHRFLELANHYPSTAFSCLIDNFSIAGQLNDSFQSARKKINVYIDLNVGMNRTGISCDHAFGLFKECQSLSNLNIVGLHAYDGHIRDADLDIRTRNCNQSFIPVLALRQQIEKEFFRSLAIVAGGTPTFPIHAKRQGVECSPGTFVYWDIGYSQGLPDQPFLFAAVVITRVISKPTPETVCVDLGHKAIASENALDKRVRFLNAPDGIPIGHSEEHLILQFPSASSLAVGDVLYGIPYHVCPTCALYDNACTTEKGNITGTWKIQARSRKLTL
jgi:D-threonine aldolase